MTGEQQDIRVCPLIWNETLTEGKSFVRCDEHCAWYLEEEDCCAVVQLARESRRQTNQQKNLTYLGRMR